MEKSVFAYVRRYGMRQIIVILLIMVPMFILQMQMYQLPKVIIDDAIGGPEGIRNLLGLELERLEYLWLLCAAFLMLVLIIGLIKFIVQTLKGIMAERLLRRLRFQLLSRTLRFPLRHFQKTSQNEIVTMVTAEAEPLGGFFGEAYIQPAFQGGIFIVVLTFLLSQNVILGLVAAMSMPIQAWLVPRLQKRIRHLGKQRVKTVRALSERIGEAVSGIEDLHANDGIRYVKSDFSQRLGKIFEIRYEIYRRKFFMKFLNNFINQLTPFFFYSIGGYLVITGSLSLGALTAGLVAYKDLAGPWKELLNWYQLQADSAVKYDSLLEQFQPADIISSAQQEGIPAEIPNWNGRELSFANVSLQYADDVKRLDHVSTHFQSGDAVLVTGSPSGGKNEFAMLFSGLIQPTSGQIKVGNEDLAKFHHTVLGCRMGYVGPEGAIFSGTLRDNLLLGLKRVPSYVAEDAQYADFIKEAKASGNSEFPFEAEWLTLSEAGLKDEFALRERYTKIISLLGVEEGLFSAGMQATINQEEYPELAAGLLKARHQLVQHLSAQDDIDLVNRFSANSFNRYASVAENIVFGQPVNEEFSFRVLGENTYIHRLLKQQGLQEEFLDIGLKLARLTVEMFQGVEPNEFFYERFSFVRADTLPLLSSIVRRYDKAGETLEQQDINLLYSLVFQLTPQRHRLDLIDSVMEERLVELRHAFRAGLSAEMQGSVQFFNEDAYNAGLSIQSNILFGRIAHGRAHAEQRIGDLLVRVIEDLGLRDLVIQAALDLDIGKGGSRLPLAQRQVLVLARTLMKDPYVIVINTALSALSVAERERIATELIRYAKDKILIWVDNQALDSVPFTRQLEIEAGSIHVLDGQLPVTSVKGKSTPQIEGDFTTLASEVEQLLQVPLFSSLSRQHLRLLAFASEVVHFNAGEMVFRQHEVGEHAFVIFSGVGEILLKQKGVAQRRVNVVSVNSLVGEMALLGDADTRRSASFLVTSDMECLKISREVFVELIQQNSTVATQINRLLSKRLQATMRMVESGADTLNA